MRTRLVPARGSGLTRNVIALSLCLAGNLQAIETRAAPARAPAAGEAPYRVNESLFKALQWRCIGPYRGGRALAVAGIAGDANTFYFGAVAGGVWKTTDAGATWMPLTDGTPISSVGAIALAPSDPNIIYVGTGEAAPRGDMTYGDGVYKSLDGGKSWSNVGLQDTREIGALNGEEHDPDFRLAAAFGHCCGP